MCVYTAHYLRIIETDHAHVYNVRYLNVEFVCVCVVGVYTVSYSSYRGGYRSLHCVPAEFIIREESGGAPGYIHIIFDDTSLHARPPARTAVVLYIYMIYT